MTNNASIRLYQPSKFQSARCARAAINRQGYFLIYSSILEESCSLCNNSEKFSAIKHILGNGWSSVTFDLTFSGTICLFLMK